MTIYYKATRPDGTDFRTGTIDYAGALERGETLTHPGGSTGTAADYFSVSVEAADCTGFRWPCRLFRVEPVEPWDPGGSVPNKRACLSLRVVEELPAHLALGPNGEAVAVFIDSLRRMSAAQRAAAWDTARVAAGDARAAAWAAAGVAAGDARAAAWDTSRAAAWEAAAGVAADTARVAAWAAARALVVRDLISRGHYDTLTAPMRAAGVTVHPDDPALVTA